MLKNKWFFALFVNILGFVFLKFVISFNVRSKIVLFCIITKRIICFLSKNDKHRAKHKKRTTEKRQSYKSQYSSLSNPIQRAHQRLVAGNATNSQRYEDNRYNGH